VATYHNSVSVIKRSAGKSAVAAAAYRSGDKLKDERTGLTHDYTRKSGVDHSVILTPVKADWITDRQQLWNKVEATEKRHDAQLAREITVAIPTELTRENQTELVREYVQKNYVDLGMIADINFHHLDGDNPHAHIMVTMRDLKIDERGDVSFGNKNRDWNDKDLLVRNREQWANLANQYLIDAGCPDVQIDHRSNADRGIETIPQIHLGVEAAAMRKKGIASERGDEYDRIEAANISIREKLEQIYESESATRELEQQLMEFDRQVTTDIEVTPPEIPKIPVVTPNIQITPPKVRDLKQERKDNDLLLVAGDYPELRKTLEYQEAKERARIRYQEQLKSMPKQVAEPTPPPAVKKWEPTLQQKTDPQLVRSILETAEQLGTDGYKAGNYQVQILEEQIEVKYRNELAMVIDISLDSPESQLIGRGFTLNQYERGLGGSIDVLVTDLEQQQEQEQAQAQEREQQRQAELQRQLEQQRQLERELSPEISFNDSDDLEIDFSEPSEKQDRSRDYGWNEFRLGVINLISN
jgi:MobA/MobL family